MAAELKKRKREVAEEPSRKIRAVESENESDGSRAGSDAVVDAQEIFRRHFEAQFKPLPEVKKKKREVVVVEEEEEDEDEDDWDGLSEEEDSNEVDVVEDKPLQQLHLMSKAELKAFMSPKPPTALEQSSLLKPSSSTASSDDPTEGNNLKNDLALQRLLTESHLLDSSSSPVLSGNNRHKATDLRLRKLGAKTSILEQKKMPLSHYRGIMKKKADTEEKRRVQAKENGIILEKAQGKVMKGKRRERGIGAPGVGKFRGGTLSLSKKDVREIEGPKRSGGKGGRGGRGGGRGRGGKKRGH